MQTVLRLLAAAGVSLVFSAASQAAPAAADPHASHQMQAMNHAMASNNSLTEGEVRKVDKEQAKLTLRHGPIRNLDMPGMTMIFKVADPKLLNRVKEGDKVRFVADRVNGVLTVTSIEPVAAQ